MNEEKLAKEIEAYRELAKADKKVDIATLTINALQKHQPNFIDPKQKRWSYLISLIIPPAGLILALNYYFSDKDDAMQTALMCSLLTVASITLSVLIFKSILSTGII